MEHNTERSAASPQLVLREHVAGEIVGLLVVQMDIPALIGLDGDAFAADRETFTVAGEGLSEARPNDRASRRPEMMKADPNEAGVGSRRWEPPQNAARLVVESYGEVPGAGGGILVARTIV